MSGLAATGRIAAPVGLGLALSAAAYLLLGAQDAAIKWLTATLPVWQILFLRSLSVAASFAAVGGRPLLRRAAASPVRRVLLLRGVVTFAAWFCYFTAARDLPLAELGTLYFTAPVLVVLLAVPLLGERAGPLTWGALALGFAGVLVTARPGSIALSPAAALALLAALLWACGVVLMRWIARRESSAVQILCNNLVHVAASCAGALATWQAPSPAAWLVLALAATLAVAGQWCLFEGARHAPATRTAPLEYTALAWAFLLGYLVWGHVPNASTWAGAALVLCAGALTVLARR